MLDQVWFLVKVKGSCNATEYEQLILSMYAFIRLIVCNGQMATNSIKEEDLRLNLQL